MISLSGGAMSRLHSQACKVITQSHDDAFNEIIARSIRPNQWENIYTAHLCRVMHQVARSWKAELAKAVPGLGLSMATVFTHQTPYVKWAAGANRKRCELADVLLVFVDRSSGVPQAVAALVQAKLSTTGGVSLSSTSERKQFDLLSTRPIFDVDAVGAPTQIDLKNLAPDTALLYGLTGPRTAHLPSGYSGVHHWLTADNLVSSAGSYTVTGKDCLAYVLTGMLVGNFGWKLNLPAKGGDWTSIASQTPRDDWSTLINYLLHETFKKPVSAAYISSMGRSSRGQEDLLYCTATNSTGQPMFFLGYELSNSIVGQNFSEGLNSDLGNWQPSSIESVSVADGGNSENGGDLLEAGDSSEGGPISAILFEIGAANE